MLGTLAYSAFISVCPSINQPAQHRSMQCSSSRSSSNNIRSRSVQLVQPMGIREQYPAGIGRRLYHRSSTGENRAPICSCWLCFDCTSGCNMARSWNAVLEGSSNPATRKRRRRPRGHATVGGRDGLYQTAGTRSTDDVILDDPFEELDDRKTRYPCVFYNTLDAPTPYAEGWEWQKQAVGIRAASSHDFSELDAVLITQHNPVFTLGTGSTLGNLKFAPEDAPFEVVRTERGGEVTYHGPGQIVLYPILNLRRYRQDIHWYLRALEETVIRTLAKLGLRAERIEGLTGVWVEGRKVAAVGVRVKRWVTMHGLSLNVRPNLRHFEHIVPCGIGDRPVGSVEQLCQDGEDTSLERVGALLIESFEEVFGLEAIPIDDLA